MKTLKIFVFVLLGMMLISFISCEDKDRDIDPGKPPIPYTPTYVVKVTSFDGTANPVDTTVTSGQTIELSLVPNFAYKSKSVIVNDTIQQDFNPGDTIFNLKVLFHKNVIVNFIKDTIFPWDIMNGWDLYMIKIKQPNNVWVPTIILNNPTQRQEYLIFNPDGTTRIYYNGIPAMDRPEKYIVHEDVIPQVLDIEGDVANIVSVSKTTLITSGDGWERTYVCHIN